MLGMRRFSRLSWRRILFLGSAFTLFWILVFSLSPITSPLPPYTGPHEVGILDLETAVEQRVIHDAVLKETGEPAFQVGVPMVPSGSRVMYIQDVPCRPSHLCSKLHVVFIFMCLCDIWSLFSSSSLAPLASTLSNNALARYARCHTLLSLNSPANSRGTLSTMGAAMAPSTNFPDRNRIRTARRNPLRPAAVSLHLRPMGARLQHRDPRRRRRAAALLV